MSNLNPWQSGTAVLMMFGLLAGAAPPVLVAPPAVAQLLPQSSQVKITAGSLIPVTYDEAERIVLKPEETMDVTLKVSQNVTSSMGTILIPKGSQIEGQLRPVEGGTQFVGQELILKNGNRVAINATSAVLTRQEKLRRNGSTGSILKGAAIGAAASAVISEIFGDISLIKVLGGAGAGALGGYLLGRKSTEVIVVEPQDLASLRLNSDLILR